MAQVPVLLHVRSRSQSDQLATLVAVGLRGPGVALNDLPAGPEVLAFRRDGSGKIPRTQLRQPP